jgi:hypothetical protein
MTVAVAVVTWYSDDSGGSGDSGDVTVPPLVAVNCRDEVVIVSPPLSPLSPLSPLPSQSPRSHCHQTHRNSAQTHIGTSKTHQITSFDVFSCVPAIKGAFVSLAWLKILARQQHENKKTMIVSNFE